MLTYAINKFQALRTGLDFLNEKDVRNFSLKFSTLTLYTLLMVEGL